MSEQALSKEQQAFAQVQIGYLSSRVAELATENERLKMELEAATLSDDALKDPDTT